MKDVLIAVPAVLAGLLHVYIFVMESLRLTAPRTMQTFGIRSREDAEIIRPWAYNQGWYNLLIGLQVLIGVGLLWASPTVGLTLLTSGAAIMLGAALVLITSDRTKTRAAISQGLFPALTLIAVALTR